MGLVTSKMIQMRPTIKYGNFYILPRDDIVACEGWLITVAR